MNKMVVLLIALIIVFQVSLANVSISPVNVGRVNVSPTYVSPISISPINISRVSIGVNVSYNPSLFINRVSFRTTSISPVNINKNINVNRIYVNYYNPYKVLKNSYQNIRVSYYDSKTNEFNQF